MEYIGSGIHKVHVKILDSIAPGDLVSDISPCNRQKLLFINTLDNLKKFIDKYGYIDDNNIVKIKWGRVALEYYGFGFYFEKQIESIFYKGNTYPLDWENKYSFDKFISFQNNKQNKINKIPNELNELNESNESNESKESNESNDHNGGSLDLVLLSIIIFDIVMPTIKDWEFYF